MIVKWLWGRSREKTHDGIETRSRTTRRVTRSGRSREKTHDGIETNGRKEGGSNRYRRSREKTHDGIETPGAEPIDSGGLSRSREKTHDGIETHRVGWLPVAREFVEAGRKPTTGLKPFDVDGGGDSDPGRSREKTHDGIETAMGVRHRDGRTLSKQGENPRRD